MNIQPCTIKPWDKIRRTVEEWVKAGFNVPEKITAWFEYEYEVDDEWVSLNDIKKFFGTSDVEMRVEIFYDDITIKFSIIREETDEEHKQRLNEYNNIKNRGKLEKQKKLRKQKEKDKKDYETFLKLKARFENNG